MLKINTRLEKLESIAKQHLPHTALTIFEDTTTKEHLYHIYSYTDHEIITNDLDKFYKDNDIDINDKNTHIIHIPIVKERTLQDVLGNE